VYLRLLAVAPGHFGYLKKGANCVSATATGVAADSDNANCALFYVTASSGAFLIRLLSDDSQLRFASTADGKNHSIQLRSD
jgi:hypothetical protein